MNQVRRESVQGPPMVDPREGRKLTITRTFEKDIDKT